MYRKESVFWCGPHDTNIVQIKLLLFLVIFQTVCIFSGCMPQSNHLLKRGGQSNRKLTSRRTSVISVRPSVRPSGGSGHETAGLDLLHSHPHHRWIPLRCIPAASSSRPQPHTRASAQSLRSEHGRGGEETGRLRRSGQPRPGRLWTAGDTGSVTHTHIPIEQKVFTWTHVLY